MMGMAMAMVSVVASKMRIAKLMLIMRGMVLTIMVVILIAMTVADENLLVNFWTVGRKLDAERDSCLS